MAKDWTGNKKSMRGALGIDGIEPRQADDYYATQPIAARFLMQLEELNENIWEPSVGEGHLAKPLIEAGYKVKCTDLIDRGFGQGGIDFFEQTEIFNGDIVTNPPYKYGLPYVEHALELIPEGNKVCLFLKLQFLEGKAKRKFFDRNPPIRVWVSSSRLPCGKNGVFPKNGGACSIRLVYMGERVQGRNNAEMV